MSIKFSLPLFRHVAGEISRGRPIWGMLCVNEYLSPEDPLHYALAARAEEHLPSETDAPRHLVERVLRGAPLQTFSRSEQEQLRSSLEPARGLRRGRPTPKSIALRRRMRRKASPARYLPGAQRKRAAVGVVHPLSGASNY